MKCTEVEQNLEDAPRACIATDEIERIERARTEPTIAVLRRLAAALDADGRLTPSHDLGVGFETRRLTA